jgi:hypothetical protein
MSISDIALLTLMPFQKAGTCKINPAPSELEFHTAVSEAAGAVPPQLALSARSVPVADLKIIPARAGPSANKIAAAKKNSTNLCLYNGMALGAFIPSLLNIPASNLQIPCTPSGH